MLNQQLLTSSFTEFYGKNTISRHSRKISATANGKYQALSPSPAYMQSCTLLTLIYSWLASYPGSNYAGEEKRAWYTMHAHAPNFPGFRGIPRILPYTITPLTASSANLVYIVLVCVSISRTFRLSIATSTVLCSSCSVRRLTERVSYNSEKLGCLTNQDEVE